MILCHCAVVSDREVRDAIAAGATDVCALAEVCGTSRACGGCLPAVRTELQRHGLPTDDGFDARTIRATLRERARHVQPASVAS
jgi:bacterioferritin-associated ferredoxin